MAQPDLSTIGAAVSQIIATAWPQRFEPAALGEDVPLGEEGLGLDSVEVVEVILACEERFGRRSTDELFAVAPLTVGRIAEFFAS